MLKKKIEFQLKRNKVIRRDSPVFIIAEIGINHEGDFSTAKKLVKEALKSGADAVKFQIVNPNHSYTLGTPSYNLFKKSLLTEEEYKYIFRKFNSKGNIFATPGDLDSLKLCERLNIKFYKVSSGLCTNTPLLEEIKRTRKPIIISTGMANENEIKNILKITANYSNNNICLLHTVSLYPTPLKNINLYSIKYIEEKYNVIVGYSDHCLGWEACKIAVASGAKVIEKHFTLDASRKGFDHKISLRPNDFKKMVKEIRDIEKTLGKFTKEPHQKEIIHKSSIVRYCVASKVILKGDKFDIKNVHFKRTEKNKSGIKAYDFQNIKFKKSKFSYNKGDLIKG